MYKPQTNHAMCHRITMSHGSASSVSGGTKCEDYCIIRNISLVLKFSFKMPTVCKQKESEGQRYAKARHPSRPVARSMTGAWRDIPDPSPSKKDCKNKRMKTDIKVNKLWDGEGRGRGEGGVVHQKRLKMWIVK